MWNIFKKEEKSELDLAYENNLINYEDYKFFKWHCYGKFDIEQYNNLTNICHDISSLIWGSTVKMLFECINSDGNYDKVRYFSVSKYLKLNNKNINEGIEELYLDKYLRKSRCEDYNHFKWPIDTEVDNKKLISYHDVCYSIKEIAIYTYMIIIHYDNITQGFEIDDDNDYILTDDENEGE